MASPVSIGDAFLMAKLALKIGQALTKGRKSAPSEFREVESLLYSLSVALDAVASAYGSSDRSASMSQNGLSLPNRVPSHLSGNQDVLLGVLQSCRGALSYLEAIIDRYSIIGESGSSDESSFARRWSQALRTNWRKIVWTTEGGDLATLKANLTVYTNSLNLILGVMNNSQAGRLESNLNSVSSILGEIHEWFVDNIKNVKVASKSTTATPSSASKQLDEDLFANFRCELYRHHGQQLALICPTACLTQDALDIGHIASMRDIQLFTCQCSKSNPDTSRHESIVAAYSLSPDSFAARIAGNERSWLLHGLFNNITDQVNSLVVKKVPTKAMYDFEEILVHSLGVFQSRQMFSYAASTFLSDALQLDKKSSRANVLGVIGNAANSRQAVASATLIHGKARYERPSVESVRILHYRTIGLDHLMDEAALSMTAFEESEEAEILISFGTDARNPGSESMVRLVLALRWNSAIEFRPDVDTISLIAIDCTGFDIDDRPGPTTCATVELVFTDPPAASSFHRELEAVRMDLFIIRLQYPRADEVTLLKIQAEGVHTERMHLREAEIVITKSTLTNVYRLIVRSRRGYSVISQELTNDFLEAIARSGSPDYGAMTYEAFIDDTGKRRLRQCPKGFGYLMFSDSEIEQLLRLGIATISGSSDPSGPGDMDAGGLLS